MPVTFLASMTCPLAVVEMLPELVRVVPDGTPVFVASGHPLVGVGVGSVVGGGVVVVVVVGDGDTVMS